MTRSHRGATFAVVAFLGLVSPSIAARFDDVAKVAQAAHRRALIEHMRIAAADRLIEQQDEIAAYTGAGFNTVVLYDTEEWGGLKNEERIAFETTFARAHHLHIVLGKATEMSDVSDDEIRDRLQLWDRYGHDDVIAVFFLHDDAFLIHAGVERQRHLYTLAHETVRDWYVLGMIGEFGFNASTEEVAQYFDPNAFDHVIMLMFPLNIGYVTGVRLDSATAADPDASMREYVRRYMARMTEKFISHLNHDQLVIVLIQAFAYTVEPAGHIPRPADVIIQAEAGSQLLQKTAGQERNRALAYFLWDGSRSGMFGLWQRPDWRDAAVDANRAGEQRMAINP